jgi:hypothetical protein
MSVGRRKETGSISMYSIYPSMATSDVAQFKRIALPAAVFRRGNTAATHDCRGFGGRGGGA